MASTNKFYHLIKHLKTSKDFEKGKVEQLFRPYIFKKWLLILYLV